MKLIITVPHGKCMSEAKERTCDLSALYMAEWLQMEASGTGIDAEMLAGDILRKDTDLNRYPGRGKSFRTKLSQELKKMMCEGEKVFVLDVHSFPVMDVVGMSFGEAMQMIIESQKSTFGDNQIALLSLEGSSKEAQAIANSIKGYKVGFFHGDVKNDILLETKTLGGYGVLLEVSEGLKKEDLRNIAKQIIKGLKSQESSCVVM